MTSNRLLLGNQSSVATLETKSKTEVPWDQPSLLTVIIQKKCYHHLIYIIYSLIYYEIVHNNQDYEISQGIHWQKKHSQKIRHECLFAY